LTANSIVANDRSIWRWRAALPLGHDPVVTLGEGGTPMIRTFWAGRPIEVKHDYLNPSDSFKDRGMAVIDGLPAARRRQRS
jgi:threonine synthase